MTLFQMDVFREKGVVILYMELEVQTRWVRDGIGLSKS